MNVTDLRADCDPCDDVQLSLDFTGAQKCPLPVSTVVGTMRSAICVLRGDEEPLPPAFDITEHDYHQPDFLEALYQSIGPDMDRVLLRCASDDDHVPLFTIACVLVLTACLLNRPLVVYLDAADAGIPGSTVTIRRFLRELMAQHMKATTTIAEVRTLLADLALFYRGA